MHCLDVPLAWSCLTELNGKCTMLTNIAAFLLKIFCRKCFADVKRAFIN